MHFSVFINVEVPHVEDEPELDAGVLEEMEKLRQKMSEPNPNFMHGIYLEQLHAKTSAFARDVVSQVESFMEPYYDQTEDEEYLDFSDETERLQKEYEEGTTDCFLTPDGKLVMPRDEPIRYRFVIRDGIVYEKSSKYGKPDKRTKSAKKLRALTNYPYKRIYKSLAEYAEKEYSWFWNEEEQAYGYYYNPNSVYDWYVIGGRWPNMFLVKDTCEEYCRGEVRDDSDSAPVPEGYRWVSAARKRDIEWEVMHSFHREAAIRNYHEYVRCFAEQRLPEHSFCSLAEDGIRSWNKIVYVKGETLDEYLTRTGYGDGAKPYPIPYGYISDGEFFSKCSETELAEYIESVPDDDVLVCIDCHE